MGCRNENHRTAEQTRRVVSPPEIVERSNPAIVRGVQQQGEMLEDC
jgi:hypothetical protein